MENSKNCLSGKNSHPRDNQIKFIEEGHIYIIDGMLNKPISVTTLIHKYFDQFDADKIIDKMMMNNNWINSKYYGKTKSQIKQDWEKNRDESATAGTLLHKQIEEYININLIPDKSSKEFNLFLNFWDSLIGRNPDYHPFRTEWLIYDESVCVAGSIDFTMIDENNNIVIFDWKRSKEIKYNNKYQKGKEFLNHLDDCNYNHYQLQLNCYRHILETKYNLNVIGMFLVVCHPNNNDPIYIPVSRMTEEINNMWNQLKINLYTPTC